MGQVLSVDVVQLVAKELSVEDVLAAASTCHEWRASLESTRLWRVLFAQRFGHAVSVPAGLSWKTAFSIVHRSARLRFDPAQTFGGRVLLDDSFFLAHGTTNGLCKPPLASTLNASSFGRIRRSATLCLDSRMWRTVCKAH